MSSSTKKNLLASDHEVGKADKFGHSEIQNLSEELRVSLENNYTWSSLTIRMLAQR